MEGFLKSFLPFWQRLKKLKKYRLEIFFILIALVIAFISIFIYIKTGEKTENEIVTEEQAFPNISRQQKIIIDIAGAVENPDVYEISSGARLKDILILAGGLSAEADRQYFSRNFNLARIISDQEKIYVPSVIEVQNGLFVENVQTINYLQPVVNQQSITDNQQIKLTNINSATIEELDQLPGIGKITAAKIIQNRPYQSTEDLINKKIVKKNVWEQIKNLITF